MQTQTTAPLMTDSNLPRVPDDIEHMFSNVDQMISTHTHQRTDETSVHLEPIYFDPKAKLNSDAMQEYNLENREAVIGKGLSTNDVDFIERFDGRGRKVRIKMGKIQNPVMQKIGYSFAVVNF